MSISNEEFKKLISNLNPGQKEAVSTIYGPVIVLAGPGSGKTHVLSLRIANILANTDTNPENIVALTFTESAAQNMVTRLAKLIGPQAYKLNITTFHGFANQIVQTYPQKFVYRKELQQISEIQKYNLLESVISDLELEQLILPKNPSFYNSDILKAISTLKRQGVTPKEYEKLVDNHIHEFSENAEVNPNSGKYKSKWRQLQKSLTKNSELAEIYSSYQTKLTDMGLYDFDDMLQFVVTKFDSDPEFKLEIQEKYQFMMVDEFQDTNGVQSQMLFKIMDYEQPNIFVVGDDDQGIFSFQGANLGNLTDFLSNYPNSKIVTLVENYRSVQEILDSAQNVITQNKYRFVNQIPGLHKNLVAGIPKNTSKGRKPIEIWKFDSDNLETDTVVSKIVELKESGVNLTDISIIYRTHADAKVYIERLTSKKIPIKTDTANNVLADSRLHFVISGLKAVSDPLDSMSLWEFCYGYLGVAPLGVDIQLSFLMISHKYGHDKSEDLLDILMQEDESGVWKTIAEQIVALSTKSRLESASYILTELLKISNLVNYKDTVDNLDLLQKLYTFQQFVQQQDQVTNPEIYNLSRLLIDIEQMQLNNISLPISALHNTNSGVNLLTAHRAKGLEFDHVFIVKAIAGNWGGKISKEKLKLISLRPQNERDNHQSYLNNIEKVEKLEEERRLFFVALTRAKTNLYISYADSYKTDDPARPRVGLPSEFLEDLPDNFATFRKFSNENSSTSQTITELVDLLKESPVFPEINQGVLQNYLKSQLRKFRLSQTSMQTYLDCPRRFLFTQLLRVPRFDTNSHVVIGSVLHKLLEKFFNSLDNHAPILKTDGKNYEQFLVSVITREMSPLDIDKETKKLWADEILKIFSDYYAEELVNWSYEVVSVEQSLSDAVYKGIPLTGKIDLISKQGKDKVLVDFKSGKPKSRNAILGKTKSTDYASKYFDQLVFYTILTDNAPHHEPINIGEIRFLQPRPSGKFADERFEIGLQDKQFMLEKITDVYTHIQKLDFTLACGLEDCEICRYD